MQHFYLTPVLGGPVAPRYLISEKPKLLGRSEQADVPLLEPTVSRQHAAIQLHNGEVVLEDLGSKHGTFVNSRRITSAKLKPGDVIVFGLTLVLRLEVSENQLSSDDSEAEDEVKTWTGVAAVSALTTVPTASGPVDRAELDMLQDKLAAARKLAGAGALCAVRLPAACQQIDELLAQLRKDKPDGDTTLGQMTALRSELNDIVMALGSTVLHIEPVALRDAIDRASQAVMHEITTQELRLRIDVARDVKINADENRLVAALIELLRNACQASPKKGTVEIDTLRGAGQVSLAIRDHGSGISDDLAQRAFDPFVTLPADGQSLGLGLLLARQLIMSMGAGMVLESSAVGGTTVRLRLPLST